MITVRQIERLWNDRQHERILSICLEMRAEDSPRLRLALSGSPAAAAAAIIRLDELNQGHAPLYTKMLRALLAAQQADGGWGDPLTTALCIRALACGNGAGLAIDRGLAYLAAMQKTDGTWPDGPIRRMTGDPFVSAFILRQLSRDERFARAVRLDDALRWFEAHEPSLDDQTASLWRMVKNARLRPGRWAPAAKALPRGRISGMRNDLTHLTVSRPNLPLNAPHFNCAAQRRPLLAEPDQANAGGKEA